MKINSIEPEHFYPEDNIADVQVLTTAEIPGYLLSTDWANAYDRIDRAFLFKVMDKFGFPQS